ncbi:Phage protein Gp19/Gp15/Gp42 [Nocardia amikacinitolerans]|uniref:Phage protein Gp19/Gp15/Gp42 n=1 Tax=Nocardia amikacinitolerans TaxID=756689 RepID=A0A285LGH2_9NOCA|nr:Gp19/Gp15/Gp42 family protein [Nocardia amikacinitolerans]SNY84069.1 Phage protein Gp19/Gp15/Gp42 [Nocardia amikacinitolerans]
MADFATPAQLEAFWHPLSEAEEERATVLLGYVAALIRNEWSDIDDRIASFDDDPRPADALDPTVPQFISITAVKRAMIGGTSGGDGVSSEMKVGGPYTHQTSYSNPMGNLYLTATERRQLSPGGARRRAFTVNPIAETAGTGLPYWDWERAS